MGHITMLIERERPASYSVHTLLLLRETKTPLQNMAEVAENIRIQGRSPASARRKLVFFSCNRVNNGTRTH